MEIKPLHTVAELALLLPEKPLGVRPYDSRRWRKLARQQLRDHPLCNICLQSGQVVPATIADHIKPHEGDPTAFWLGKLQSLCLHCHNGFKQQIDNRGYATDIGIDGWPIDPNHPTNKQMEK